MIYTNEVIRIHNLHINVKQINKTKARILFDEGKTIYLHPCNMVINSVWSTPTGHNKNGGYKFDQLVNEWKYYNCSNELGKYPNFFIEVK